MMATKHSEVRCLSQKEMTSGSELSSTLSMSSRCILRLEKDKNQWLSRFKRPEVRKQQRASSDTSAGRSVHKGP